MSDNNVSHEPDFSADDAERMLAGRKPSHPELERLAGELDALRARAQQRASLEDAQHVAPALAREAEQTWNAHAEATTAGVGSAPAKKARWRVAAAGAAAAVLGITMAGTAAASQDTLPGDALYGLNRALESVGVFEGGLDKRLEEARLLAERGDEEAAIEHAVTSLEEEGDEESAEELRAAAESVLRSGSEQSLDVRTAVADMLQWMADTELEGRDFGQGVAERARAIGGHGRADAGEAPGKSGEAPGQSDKPETVPGKSGEAPGQNKGSGPGADDPRDSGKANKPDKPKNTDKPDKPETANESDRAGKPDGAGKPEGAGRP